MLRPGCWLSPPTPLFCVGDTNMLVSENAKICVFPDASQWNIGCVGSLALGLCVGHVHFIFFVLIPFALGSRRKRSFQWNMGFRYCIWLHNSMTPVTTATVPLPRAAGVVQHLLQQLLSVRRFLPVTTTSQGLQVSRN